MGLPEESKGREFPRLSFPTDKRSGDSNALLKVDPKRLEHVTLLLRLEFLSNRGAVAVPAVLGEAGPVEPPTVPEPPDLNHKREREIFTRGKRMHWSGHIDTTARGDTGNTIVVSFSTPTHINVARQQETTCETCAMQGHTETFEHSP